MGASLRHAVARPSSTRPGIASWLAPDLIVNTVSATINVDAYLSLLALNSVLANVGVGTEPLSLNGPALVSQRGIVTDSLIGGLRETREMLGFCAKHNLGAEIEVIPAGKINEAYERVLASDVRYRFVIDNSTLAEPKSRPEPGSRSPTSF